MYQALPALPYCKRQKAGRGTGYEAICCVCREAYLLLKWCRSALCAVRPWQIMLEHNSSVEHAQSRAVKVTGSLRAVTRTVYLIKRYFIVFLSPKTKPCDPTWTWKTVLK